MELKDRSTSLQEAWNRFTDNSYTIEDLSLILDSIKDDENLSTFYEVLNKIGNESISTTLPKTKEQKEEYRREATRIFTEYQNNRKVRPTPVPSRSISRFRKIWYAAAAVLLLGILTPAAYFYMRPKTEQTNPVVQYAEVVTQRGEIKTIFLPDQTKVMLNVDSRLTYPIDFTNERSVELQGQAIFDVTTDNGRPFMVMATDMKVRVLGTVFDVKSYSDDVSSQVSVASGKVEVELSQENVETRHDTPILLEKNQQVKVNKTIGSFEKLTIDVDKCLSWTDGSLYFNQTPIKEVVNMLNRHYPHVNIELAEGEYSDVMSGEHDNKSLEAVLISINYLLGVKHKKEGNKIILYQP
jgi:ferric-dicitrate binding protein FerR (iron transport regulator)